MKDPPLPTPPFKVVRSLAYLLERLATCVAGEPADHWREAERLLREVPITPKISSAKNEKAIE